MDIVVNGKKVSPLESYLGVGRAERGPMCKCGHRRSAHVRKGHTPGPGGDHFSYRDASITGVECSCGAGRRGGCFSCSCKEFTPENW